MAKSATVRVEICTTIAELTSRRAWLIAQQFKVVCAEEGDPDLVLWRNNADDPIGAAWVLVGIKG